MDKIIKKIYNFYNSGWKILIFVFIIGFMILSIKVYTENYLNIQNTIYQTKHKQQTIEDKIAYINQFEIPYIQSSYYQISINHKNKIPSNNFIMIQVFDNDAYTKEFDNKNNSGTYIVNLKDVKKQEEVLKGWRSFLEYKWSKIFE